jgi:hypothetical protein
MNLRTSIGTLVLVAVAAAGCDVFEDQSPENLGLTLTGSEGMEVQAVYSTAFIAGVNEEGVTQVQIFSSDTVMHVLPIDTVVNIARDKQLFVEVLPMPTDTLNVSVRVDIDGRDVLNNSGYIFPDVPWRYVYQFNQYVTDIVEVVL